MNWLEVSLTVEAELAESVADLLARFAPNGVMTEQGVRFTNDEDEGTPTGPIHVRAYLPMDERLEDTRSRLEEGLFYLGMIRPISSPLYNEIADQNWMEAWKQHYQPILIGQRLLILPAWMESPDPNRIAIKIDPGMAFGTGTHPTTQLCLGLIERVFDEGRMTEDRGLSSVLGPRSVIDVGCGSGILSIAALKLGAKKALGVDIDEESLKNSRANAEANGVEDKLVLGLGSVTEIRRGQFEVQSAQLVVANILAPVIIRLFDAGLADLVEPGGRIILSGILEHQTDSVIQSAQAAALHLVEKSQMTDWVALALER